jgi:hypothetical protein
MYVLGSESTTEQVEKGTVAAAQSSSPSNSHASWHVPAFTSVLQNGLSSLQPTVVPVASSVIHSTHAASPLVVTHTGVSPVQPAA